MKERPILFSGEMVGAILEGRKTQTRRVVTVPWRGSKRTLPYEPYYVEEDGVLFACDENGDYEPMEDLLGPFGAKGDRLWVRETWAGVSKHPEPAPLTECVIEYRADLPAGSTDYPGQWPAEQARGDEDAPKWRPSIHMPRSASRISLEIEQVRVQRVQAIVADDLRAEGVQVPVTAEGRPLLELSGPYAACEYLPRRRPPTWTEEELLRAHYAALWDRLNADRGPGYAWSGNPWVWAITFRRVS